MNKLLEFTYSEAEKELTQATERFLEFVTKDHYEKQSELARLIAWCKYDILWDAFGWGVSFSKWGNLNYTHHFSVEGSGAISSRLDFIGFFIGHEILDDGDPCIAQQAYILNSGSNHGYTKDEYEAELLVQEKLEKDIKALKLDNPKFKNWKQYFKLTEGLRHFKPFICSSQEVTGWKHCDENDVINCILFHINHDRERYEQWMEDDPEDTHSLRDVTHPVFYDKPDKVTEVIRLWMLENNLRPASI